MIAKDETKRKEAQKSAPTPAISPTMRPRTPTQIPPAEAAALRDRFTRGDLPSCPVAVTLRIVGNRWRPLILQRLAEGPCGHAALLAAFRPLLTQKVLTENLRALEGYGLLSRTPHPTNPPTVDYALTPLGRTLLPVLGSLAAWGARYQTERAKNQRPERACRQTLPW